MKRIIILSLTKEKEPLIKGTPYKINKFLEDNNYEVLFITSPERPGFFSMIKFIFKFYLSYLKFRPDVVITFHPISIIPVLLKRGGLIRKPVIFYWWDFYTEIMGKKWPLGLIAFSEFYCIRNSNLVMTNSLFQKNVAKRIGIDAKYFELGVEPYFSKQVKKITLPGKNDFKILYYGDITNYKNVDELIRSVNGLKCDLILVGIASKEFKENSPQNVYFVGYKEHQEIPSYIKSADLIAIPTDQDGTLKMFEALRIGKPILAKRGRINYVLDHLTEAYLTNDLRAGIEYLIKNKKIIDFIENNNQKRVVKPINEKFKEHIFEINKYLNISK